MIDICSSSASLSQEQKEDHENQIKLSHSQGSFSCCFCSQRRFKCRSFLYKHKYSVSHFAEDLKRYIDDVNHRCKICGVKQKKESHLLYHVGGRHNKVEEFLKEGDRIPRQDRTSKVQEEPRSEEALNPSETPSGSLLTGASRLQGSSRESGPGKRGREVMTDYDGAPVSKSKNAEVDLSSDLDLTLDSSVD